VSPFVRYDFRLGVMIASSLSMLDARIANFFLLTETIASDDRILLSENMRNHVLLHYAQRAICPHQLREDTEIRTRGGRKKARV